MTFKKTITFGMQLSLILMLLFSGVGTVPVFAGRASSMMPFNADILLSSTLLSYAPQADYAWHSFYGTSSGLQGGLDDGKGVTTDAAGNIYIVGTSESAWNGPNNESPLNAFAGGNPNIVVIKLNSAGAYQWHTFYGSISNDYGYAVTSDGAGNIYVAGTSVMDWYGPGGTYPINPYLGANSEDIVIIKLNSAGTYQWHTFYGSPGNANSFGRDYAYAITQDASGVYIAGHSDLTWNGPGNRAPLNPHPGYTSMVILKLNTAGTYQWHTFYGPASGSFGYAITSDDAGNVYAAGYSQGWNGPGNASPLNPYSGGTSADFVIVKLSSAGVYRWHTFYGGSGLEIANALTTDVNGNVILTGHSNATWNGPGATAPLRSYTGSGARDIVVLKLNSAGNYQWHTFYATADAENGYAVTTDEQGNIYIASDSGAWTGPDSTPPLNAHTGGRDMLVLKLNSAGSYQWHTFEGSTRDDFAYAITDDGFGNLIVAGTGKGTWNGPNGIAPLNPYHHAQNAPGSDILIVKLDVSLLTVTLEKSAGQTDPTSASPILFNVVFSSPVTGFDAQDVDLSTSTTTGTLLSGVTEAAPYNGTTYQVAVSGMTGAGNVVASIRAGAAQDEVGNTSKASTSQDNSVLYELPGPTVRYVKWSATGANNGTSWANAYNDLQSALTSATSGDEIWVAAGTYKPTAGTDRTVSFVLKNGVAIYGGFVGTETLLVERDPVVNVTILSGDIGIAVDKSDNSYHVVVGSNTNNTAVLDGFDVTAGNADQTQLDMGGGMLNYHGSPTVSNSSFMGNSAGLGGGMYNGGDSIFSVSGANPVLTNVKFINNSAIEGGGMENQFFSSPTLSNVVFSNNSAIRSGGGMVNYESSNPTLFNVTFNGNTTARGGGILNWYSNPVFTNVTLSGNSATDMGGGMYNAGSSPTLTNTLFVQNSSVWGGGMYNENYSDPTLTDVTFDSNTTFAGPNNEPASGGAIFNTDSSPILMNVTIHGNSAEYGGGIFNNTNSSPALANVTLSGNTAVYGGGMMVRDLASSPILSNVTMYGNKASDTGGAIANSGTLSVNGVTIYGNDAISGGGIANLGTLAVKNSILWADSGGEIDNFGDMGVTVVNYSIVQGGYIGTGNMDADPLLGTLHGNGGSTQTMALLPASPAIDSANDTTCPSTDQRGMTRPQGIHCDIGAYESYDGTILPGHTTRISVDSIGIQGNDRSSSSSISGDGRHIAFASSSANLVSGDTNGVQDIFVYDLQTGITTRVSVDSSNVQANAEASYPSISADGRYVAFESYATNLVPGDTNGTYDVFVHDMQTGITTRVSVDSSGVQANSDSYYPSISTDGHFVAFSSNATNLVVDDTNGKYDIFVHDMQTGMTTRASVTSSGAQANNISFYPSISGDGHYVAFESYATNLVSGDTNGVYDIFVHDMQTDSTTRVSVASNGMQADQFSDHASISADGRYIVFRSNARNLVLGDTNGATDAFMYDMQTKTTTRVSVDSNGVQANGGSQNPAISGDARYIAFDSCATNLVLNDDGLCDIYVHDIQMGTTTRVSVDSNGVPANGFSYQPAISADGQYIAFSSDATNLVSGDTNSAPDVFIHRQSILPIPPTPTYTPTATATFTPTNTPTFTPTSTPTYTPTATNTYTPTATPPYSYNPLYLSFTGSQTIGGISSADEDILKFDGKNWSLFFDGSDVGVGSSDVFAFALLDADSLLLSFNTSVTVNGITATAQDVLRFDATSLGSTTAGTFSMYFDGSDVGFDTSSESIDSLSLLPDGRLLFSTTSSPSVPGLTTGKDEDVLAFTPASLGDVTAGTWSMYFDGSDVGLAESSNEDVDALDVVDGKIYLSTLGDFAVPGLIGADEDVFICTATSIGDVTACNYSPSLYFDGSTWGAAANDVDAFNLLTLGSVPTSTPVTPPTSTSTPTRTPTATFTAAVTSTNTPVATNTPTATSGPTSTPTNTPTQAATSTYTSTPTATSTPLPTFTPTATSSTSNTIFADGFESGNFSAWSAATTGGDGVAIVQNSIVHAGNYSVKLSETVNTGSLAYIRKSLSAPENNLTISGDFMLTQEGVSGGNVPIFRVFDASGTRLLTLYRQNATNGQVWSYDGITRIQSTTLMPLNSWVHFDVHVITNGAGLSTIEVYMNGTRVIQTTAASLGTAGVVTVQIGNDTSKQPFTLYADDIALKR